MDLTERILKGDTRAIARSITKIENDDQNKENLIDSIYPYTEKAIIWGITGPPGAGKSTLVDKLIDRERKQKRKVAVIAIDPSSPFSGGALLGDRLRMQGHATDPDVFIRSMASRGHLGGVALASGDAIKILDAAGFDTIIIETIGVGQTEIEIIELSDIVLLVLAPGMGDEIQAMKAGVMEIGDIFVVNKADKDGADKLSAEIDYVLSIKYSENLSDKNPIVKTSAKNNSGIDELIDIIYSLINKMRTNGEMEKKKIKRIKKEVTKIFSGKIHEIFDKKFSFSENINKWVDEIYKKEKMPYALINNKIDNLKKEM